MSEIAMEIKGENGIPYRILASKLSSNTWYIRGRDRRRFFISHCFLAAKSNLDSTIRHIRLGDKNNPIICLILSPF